MRIFPLLFLLAAAACQPPAQPSTPDASTTPDAGPVQPPQLAWHKRSEAPPTRSNQVAFYSRTAHATLVFSGNHVTGPIHDAWSWDGAQWQPQPLAATEYPDRKNAGLAYDEATGTAVVFGGTWSGYPTPGGPHVVRVMGDTQKWVGTRWAEQQPSTSPAARGGAAMTWDAARAQALLFGGSDNVTSFDDTWSYDGTTWTQRTVNPHPSARINARMAYDPERQRVVLFSGQAITASGAAINLEDTWEWDGTQWEDVTSKSAQPPGRGHHALQWDPLKKRIMLLGGARHFSPLPKGSTLADQWEWDGATWTEVRPVGARPPPRSATSLSFDEDRRVMVLYAGFDDLDLGDLWEWDGAKWSERTTQPIPRSDYAFAQAAGAGQAVLFGGYATGGSVYLGDTHRFSDGAWHAVRGATQPPARSTASLAMHGADALLLGGRDKTSLLADGWLLKAGETDWRPLSGTLPPARRAGAMAYDPELRLTVLFGGRGATGMLADTWTFDGTTWAQLQPETAPSPRSGAKLVFDPVRKKLVLLGGTNAQQGLPNDAWVFDGAQWRPLDGLTAAPTARSSNAAVFDGFGRLITFGGVFGDAVLGGLFVHDESTGWVEVPGGPSARLDAALLDLGHGVLRTLFGAETDYATFWEDRADVWELAPNP